MFVTGAIESLTCHVEFSTGMRRVRMRIERRSGMNVNLGWFESGIAVPERRPTVVHAAGEIDRMSAPRLGACLDVALESLGPVVLDLERVSFLDAAGIRVLVATLRRSAALGTSFTLRRPSRAVNRVLEVVGVLELIDVEPASASDASAGLDGCDPTRTASKNNNDSVVGHDQRRQP